MTETNDALFVIKLPVGTKTIPFEKLAELIGIAVVRRSTADFDPEDESATDHDLLQMALIAEHYKSKLQKAAESGALVVLNQFTLDPIEQPIADLLKRSLVKVSDLRKFIVGLNGAVEIAPAPPVIRPISQNFRPVRVISAPPPDLSYKFKTPDWERWKRLDHVRLWQAACLVADVEPPEHPAMDIWKEESLAKFPAAVRTVWEVVNADAELSKLEYLPESGRMLWKTHLPGFAKWAIEKDLPVPPEMHRIAARYPAAVPVEAATPRAARIEPQGGDSLTRVVWAICYDLQDAGQNVKPSTVMAELRKLAESEEWPLRSVTAGGVKFENEGGEEREINSEALRGRIKEWRDKTGG